jgi:small subunit ribosomal protein S13
VTETKAIVRMARTDLDGTRPIPQALKSLKGVGDAYANAIAEAVEHDPETPIGDLSESEIDGIEETLENPEEADLPSWMVNRRRDRETGEDKHVVGSDLDLQEEFDIRRYQEIGSYRGWRHELGLPVRGQKTKSSFRSDDKIGVSRARIQQEATEDAGEEE